MSYDKTEEIVDFQKEIIDRIPANVDGDIRMAIIEAIEAYVDSPDPNKISLIWHVRSAYINDQEPPAAMVIALALCYKSGTLEAELKEVQMTYYTQHLDIAHHMADWTVRGLQEMANVFRMDKENEAANAIVPRIATSIPEDDDEVQEIVPSRAMLKGKGKRVASFEDDSYDDDDDDDDENQNPAKKQCNHAEINHVDDENTPRLNLLVSRKSPEKFSDPRFSRSPEGRVPAPEKTLNLNRTDFPRVPFHGDRVGTAEAMLTPRNPVPVPVSAKVVSKLYRDQADIKRKDQKAVQDAMKAQLKQKMNKINNDLVDKISHTEALRSEHENLLNNRPAAFDEKTMTDFITTSHDLASRVMKYEGDVIRGMVEAHRAQNELTDYTIEKLEERIDRMTKCMKAVGEFARLEATQRGLIQEVDE